MRKRNNANNPRGLRAVRTVGLVSVLGLVLLNTRNINVLLYPGYGENLLTVLAYGLCFIGAGLAVVAETARAGALLDKNPHRFLLLTAFWLSLALLSIGVVLIIAVLLSWRRTNYFRMHGMDRFDWYMAVGFGLAFVLSAVCIVVGRKRIRLPDKLRKVFRRGK